MAPRIVIYHLAAARSKQVEEFALDTFDEITLGRDAASTIRFDAADEDSVAPTHARIRIAGDPPRFLLQDRGSRTGTLLNGEPFRGEAEVAPGDEIELGPGGPKFVFELQPRPGDGAVRRITIPDIEPDAADAVVRSGALVPATGAVGRHIAVLPTVESRRSSGRVVAAGFLAALVVVGGMIGGAIYWWSPSAAPSASGRAASALKSPPAATRPADTVSDIRAAIAATRAPPSPETAPAGVPDLAGTVKKIAGASRFEIAGSWIELYGVDDPTIAGEHNQAVYDYLRPFAGAVACFRKGGDRFACFGGGRDLAMIAIDKGFVRLRADAPRQYRRLLLERGGGAVADGAAEGEGR
jgi:hypothetical protein